MKIGIFSKFHVSGGSEMRCIELANSICQFTSHKASLFCEDRITNQLKSRVDPQVKINQHIFKKKTERLYKTDCLIVVNTDSQLFTRADYWLGKSEKHQTFVDLSKIKQMIFLFNYIVSPSKHLLEIQQ